MNKTNAPVAFFLDADNLPSNAVEEAFAKLQESGAVVLMRRAFGGLETLGSIKEVLRRYLMQGFVNQGKGTTDVALVVDVMDLLHRGMLPKIVAIGSSDADFAPLAVRMRESGIRVICFAQKEKAAEALPRAYDEVIFVDSIFRVAVQQPVQLVKAVAAINAPPPLEIAAYEPVALTANTAQATPAKPLSKPLKPLKPPSTPAASVVAIEDALAVRKILAALPQWLPNTVRQLNQLGPPLRANEIKKGHSPLHDLFRKHPTYFKVLPTTGAPKQVKLLKKP